MILRGEYIGLYQGRVLKNEDPLGQLRVQCFVDGVCDESPWAVPMGTSGGGSPDRGGWIVPDIGADVLVMFINGNVEHPVYACGAWPTPAVGPSRPVPLKEDVPAVAAHRVPTMQLCGGIVSAYVDEREGTRKVVLQDNRLPAPGSEPFALVWDIETGVLSINNDAGIAIRSNGSIVLDALNVTIKGRNVRTTRKPI